MTTKNNITLGIIFLLLSSGCASNSTLLKECAISEKYYNGGKEKEKYVYNLLNKQAPEEVKNKEIKKIKSFELKNPLFIGDISELLFLSKYATSHVSPLAISAVKAYQKCISNEKKLMQKYESIDSRKERPNYVDLSNKAIIKLSTIAAKRIDSLANASEKILDELDGLYRAKLAGIENLKKNDQIYLILKIEKMKLIIQQYEKQVNSAAQEYDKAYKLLEKTGVSEKILNALADTAITCIYELSEKSINRSKRFNSHAKEFVRIFNNDFNKFWYADAEKSYKELAELSEEVGKKILLNMNEKLRNINKSEVRKMKNRERFQSKPPRK